MTARSRHVDPDHLPVVTLGDNKPSHTDNQSHAGTSCKNVEIDFFLAYVSALHVIVLAMATGIRCDVDSPSRDRVHDFFLLDIA